MSNAADREEVCVATKLEVSVGMRKNGSGGTKGAVRTPILLDTRARSLVYSQQHFP
jgi:hypothetical protein